LHRNGSARYVLGNVKIDQGRLGEAYELHRVALACWRDKSYGHDHHKTGDATHKLGWHLARMGHHEEAL
jgi:TolA-binding protein